MCDTTALSFFWRILVNFSPGTESRQFLLYARQNEIRGVDIDNPYYNYIISFTVPDIDNVTAVDYDALEHRIYWSDVRTQTIKRAFINGTGVETVVSAGMDMTSNDIQWFYFQTDHALSCNKFIHRLLLNTLRQLQS